MGEPTLSQNPRGFPLQTLARSSLVPRFVGKAVQVASQDGWSRCRRPWSHAWQRLQSSSALSWRVQSMLEVRLHPRAPSPSCRLRFSARLSGDVRDGEVVLS